ncbi:hypothetical protein [Janthinobacterium sp. B9-8]|uniref:hypothetical protein n=1 Tax=Janthinobacterium sp. B9-8 TaxID=1236179 RepID=UPI00061D1AFD|nr:hypothetical protein [Janthinobacterium sp. B9-8]AMC33395.1 hypothetical protein VN23_01615 [Janthinobacterium sp. B9-8]
MSDSKQNMHVIVASDVSNGRDGIGIEVYLDEEMVLEIFRDDTKKEREVTLYKKDLPLSLVENAIEVFKMKIPWEFIQVDVPSA